MIPLKDYNPTRRFPVITLLLIVINVGVYIFVQKPFDGNEVRQTLYPYEVAAIPCEVVQGRPLSVDEILTTLQTGDDSACERPSPGEEEGFPDKSVWLALLYSMFLHGSLLHIGGNMLFLWIFGNNIEDRMGIGGYIGFYLLAGLVASAAHILVQPNSTVPVVGASGAIAGVMGAYLVLFPNVRILSLIFFFIRDISAKWLLGVWFVMQFFTNANEGVAWVAHVGGFAFGALVALMLRDRLRPSRVSRFEPEPDPTW